jgi:hypothetical protein
MTPGVPTRDLVDDHRQWVAFSIEFFVASALGLWTERDVRGMFEKAVVDAIAARRYIIEHGGVHVDVDDIEFPRPELSVVRNEPPADEEPAP